MATRSSAGQPGGYYTPNLWSSVFRRARWLSTLNPLSEERELLREAFVLTIQTGQRNRKVNGKQGAGKKNA